MRLRAALALSVLGAIAVTPLTAAAEDLFLRFRPTPNMPDAEGKMRIHTANGKSKVTLKVRNMAPDTVYTIWTVFGHLVVNTDATTGAITVPAGHAPPLCLPSGGGSDPSCASFQGWQDDSGRPFPQNGGIVAPTAKIKSKFTDGMGTDPGATFVTNRHGAGEVTVALDYDIVNEAPLGNKDIIVQCVPDAAVTFDLIKGKGCADGAKLLRVTSTWHRVFIKDYPRAQRAAACANYEPTLDPETPGLTPVEVDQATAEDTRLWQCVDPATRMPRVGRWGFDHFRLANHIDDLTHGFIGGNGTDHIIDMVGRREDLVPPVPPLIPR